MISKCIAVVTQRGAGSHGAGCLCQSFFLILLTTLPALGLFGYTSTSKPLVVHSVFICLRGMPTKDHNVLPVFTELEDLRSDPMLPVTRASRLIGLMSLQERKMEEPSLFIRTYGPILFSRCCFIVTIQHITCYRPEKDSAT